MNIKQHFSTIAAQAAEQGINANEVISQRERLFKEKIVPALVAKKANDVAIKQARTEWYKQTDQVMQSAGLIPKAGQSSASFAKDKRAERAIKKSAETGSKLPIIGETILSTAENIGNTFGQGVGSMIEGAAGFIRDIGENETDSIAARTAEYGKNLKKGYEASASTMQKEIQAGGHGKVPQLASGAVQSVPAMALPMGAARGAAVGAAKLGATAAAPYIGLGVGAVAGHTQNYGEVRRNATTNLERDFPTWQHMQGNPVYEAEFNKYVQSGMDINQAKVQAHKTALDLISENAADKYGAMMTGLDFIAPSGAVLGSGILKKAPTSKVGKILAGGGVSSELVKRQMAQPQRVGMAKLAPDLSLAANKAAFGMVGKQALEEGLQGAIGEYGGQAASANIGGQSVQWGDVGKAFLEEAAIGGIMGGGMQSASRATPIDQAKSVATDLRNQTNRLRQEEAAARKELSEAIQLGDQDAINSATTNLGNIATEAAKVKSAYEQYGVDVPYFVNRFAEQAAIQPTQQDQPEQVEQSTPEQQVQPAQPQQQQPTPQAQPKSVNMGMADTTNLVMDSVSKGKITPDEASEIQSNPILADVFRLSVIGDDISAHNLVMNAASSGNITPDQAQSMIQAIPRYKQIDKPSLSGIVNNHVQQQVQQSLQSQDDLFSGATELDPETFEPIQQGQSGIIPDDPNLTDFGYQPKQNNKPVPNDPNLRDFGIDVPEAIEPVAPVPNQAKPEEQAVDFSQPKTFSNYIRANDYLKSNNLQDSHEIIKRGEGLITVQPKSVAPIEDFESEQAFDDLVSAVPPIGTPITKPQAAQKQNIEPITPEPSKEFTFAEKIKDAHINNPKIKPQLINDEVAKGRPRSEVLKEVADVVKAVNSGTASSQPTIAPVEQQPLQPKNEQAFQQGQKQVEQGAETRKTDSPSNLPNPYSENELRVRVRALNSVHNTPETFNEAIKRDFPNLYARGVELAKTATTTSAGRRGNTRFTELSFKGDDSYVSGDAWPKRPTKDEILQQAIWHLSQDDKNSAPDDVPPNNELQNNSDATQKNKAKNHVKDIALKGMATSILSGNRAEVQDMIEALGITEEEIASIQPDTKDNYLDRDFKYLPTADRVGVGSNQERAIYLPKTKGKKAQWQRIEDDYVLAMDGGRFVDLPKMTREQAIQLSNRDGENKYYDVVPRAYANHLGYKPVADIKNLADSTPEVNLPDGAKEGDIGRASDGKPFANKSAANTALKKNGLESSHAVVELAPSQFVLRETELTKTKDNDAAVKEELEKLGWIADELNEVAQKDQQATLLGNNIDGNEAKDTSEDKKALNDLHKLKSAEMGKTPEQRFKYFDDLDKAYDRLIELDTGGNGWAYKNEKEKIQNSLNKYRDLVQSKKQPEVKKTKGRTLLGKNKYGEDVFEDEKGVRSYYDPLGVFITESVTYTPNGFEYGGVDRDARYIVVNEENSASKDYEADQQGDILTETEKANGVSDDAQKLDKTSGRTLEAVSTENVPRVQETGDSAEKTRGSSNADLRGSVRTGKGNGDESARSLADGEREVSISTRGNNDSNAGLDPKQAVIANNAPVDAFVIDESEIAKGGKKTKFKANIEAIKVIKTLEAEQRPATKAEQKILSKFVGWGGLPEAFKREDGSIATGWAKEVAELESLLTKDEYDAAVDSSIAAHYTSPEIVHSLWKALENFGFEKGRVLEPAVGVGNFFGLMPKNMRRASNLYAVELDNITGAIAKNLYPEANVKAPLGFQDYQTIDNYFDVAIGNPPFSSITINDNTRPQISGFSLHNYFFAKSVDSLKPNGILAMVVTNRFLDKLGDKERAYIAERAELVGAIRLPNDAFLSNAGTQVTTDIIFLRKKEDGESNTGESWLDVKNYTDKNGNTVPLNEYFVRHPENMLGDFGAYGSMYRDGEPALIKREGQNTQELLDQAIERLPKNIFKADPSQNFEEVRATVIRNISDVKVGAMFIDEDGEVYERLPDVMGEQQSEKAEFANDKAKNRVVGMIKIAEKLASLRTMQLDKDATNKQIEVARKELNQLYDAFVKENGFINSRTNELLMRDDPNWPQLSALEDKYDRGVSAAVAKSTGQTFRKPSAQKAAIFSKRTQMPIAMVESVSNAQDALTESLNRHGYVNTKTMQQLYGKSESEIITELGNLIYNDPINGYVVRDEYLSGNVKQKLAQVQEIVNIHPEYQRNIDALEKVIPADIEALDIDVKIGSHWIPENHIEDFVSHLSGSPNAKAEYGRYSNKWDVSLTGTSVLAEANYSTSRIGVKEVVTHALNGTKPTIYDRFSDGSSQINQDATLEAAERVERVKNEWREWIWQDDARREQLERIYNDTFNVNVSREFDGSHLKFHGINNDIELRPHQKNAVWRIVQSKNTLLDHTVGAGKTFTVIAAAMEMRRMGTSNKPLIVVPNHLVGQWANDFVLLYPNANILAATKRDFEKGNRKKFIAKMANGDYDAIIIAHSSFGKISISPEQEQAFIDKEIAELMVFEAELKAQKGGRSRNAKDVAKRRLALEEKKKNLFNRENKDTDNIYWHELGIDSVMVDEAHEFKNLEFTTSMQNVAGLGTGKGSQKAKDLFAKIQIMQGSNPKSKVVFATGTPISNTMAEMFTMQRYLDWSGLQRQGVTHFDAWAKVFGEVVSDWELSPSGKYKLTNRFAKFVNMPELMQGYLSFADVMNRDDINAQLAKEGKTLGTPKIKGDKPQNIVVERSDAQADYIGVPTIDDNGNEVYPEGSLVWRTENLPRKPEKGADNMLKIMGDARKAALDMRLIDPTAEDYEGSKVNVAANNIYETYKKWNAKKGTQLVFCDLSTPKGAVAKEKARIEDLMKLADAGDEAAQAELDKLSPDELSALDSEFSVYDDLKAKLIAKGIKENEIAFIHDANTELQKQQLFEKVKRGEIRVLMGSTAKMGAGMNVQNKLVALHHLDAPWRPSDLEQREGRIIRQGNEFYKADPNGFEIEINRYATKQTLDSRMWQTIESKAKFIEQVRKGADTRSVEDIAGEAANAAEMKAASSGDPRILEEMDLRKQVKDLEESRKNFEREIHRTKNLIRSTENDIERYERVIDNLLPDIEIKQPEKFVYSNNGKKINQEDKGAREDISKVFKTGIDNAMAKGQEQSLGEINGFKIFARPSRLIGIVEISLKGNADAFVVDRFNLQDSSPVGLIQKILNHIKLMPTMLKATQDELSQAKSQLPNLRKKVDGAKWEHADKLIQLKVQHSALIEELKPKRKGAEDTSQTEDNSAPDQVRQNSDNLFTGKANSRRSSRGNGSTPSQVRQQLVNRFGDDVISQLEKNGTLTIIPTHSDPDVEGFAEGGKVTLVADAITPDNIVPVFLHELGGHVGMQGVLKPKAYENLMLEFSRLVRTGNPEAIEAKRLADRESDASVRADEYLPYLITVAARNQQDATAAQRLANRILSAIKAWAVDKLGLNLKLTPSDLVALAERMVKTVSKNPPPTPPKGRRYSKNSNPQNMSRSKQREFLDTAAKTAFGEMALRGAEGAKTLSKRTLNLFQTMLHKSLADETGEFKKTFDLVQDKINHVTFTSAKSMDVAPSVLTQLETGADYVKEVKRVGRALGNTFTGGTLGKAKIDLDIEKVGNLMFENTLQDQSKRHSEAELKKLGFDDDQIGVYNEIRSAVDSSLDTFANTTFSNIYKHLGGTTEEVLELAARDLDIHEHYKEIMSRVIDMVKNDPKKAEAGKAAAEGINRVYNKANDLKAEGYVPLMRFGKYFIRVFNPTTGEVAYRQHYESESELNIEFDKQKLDEANLPAGYVLEKSQLNELEYKLFQGVSPETVALFAKESGLPIGDAEAAYIKHSLKNNHALKRLLKRQGIKGFDTDIKRVLASFVLSNSRYSANQTYNPAIDESITNISNPAYQEDAVRLRDYSLDTQEELAGVKNFAFVYYMGFSAMFGLVNLTQPFLQTLPYLMQYSKDYGITAKSLMKAIQTWRKGTNHIEPKYKAYYERARREGHLDPQNTWMLQGLERGKSGLGASTWQLISHSSGLFAQASETINRRTSLFAALDVAESLGQAKLEKLGFKDAYDFAVRTIQETQGIYNKGNRPRVARGNVGSILMMYKQFMIAYIEQMVRMQKSGLFGGEDDEFKKKMAGLVGFGISRSVLVALGILFSLSGTTGLPFVRDILDGIETAGGLIGKPVNTEREIQIALQDALGQTLGSTVNKALMDGFVNLQPVVDVKGRMGMGDLIPATAYFSPTTSQYQKSSEVAQIGGAIGGLIEKVRESVELAQVGSYGMAGVQLLPKAATSFGQGLVAATTGDYRNMKTGVKTNDATVLDGVIKMLDAQPAGIAEQGRIRGLEMRDRAVQQSVNSRWKERYVQALESGDRKQVMEVKQEIRDYNRDNPRYPITFNQKTAETNFNKSNQSWQEKRKNTKGLEWMDDYNPHI